MAENSSVMNIIDYIRRRWQSRARRKAEEWNRCVRNAAVEKITIRRVNIGGKIISAIVVDDIITVLENPHINIADLCLTIRDKYYQARSSEPTITLL